MNFFNKKISTSLETAKQNIQNKFDSERIQMVEISINKALSEVKKAEHPKTIKTDTNSSINKSEFLKGVKFALDELANGKTAEEILAAL